MQYTKNSWYNRNCYLNNKKSAYFTFPVERNSHKSNINEKNISESFYRKKLLKKIKHAYGKAPYFHEAFEIFEKSINYPSENLLEYNCFSLKLVSKYLNIKTKFLISSKLNINKSFKGKDKIIAICKELGAEEYHNSIGGIELYSKKDFANNNIKLIFIKPLYFEYEQFGNEFVPSLSIIDIMMFNSQKDIKNFLNHYELI